MWLSSSINRRIPYGLLWMEEFPTNFHRDNDDAHLEELYAFRVVSVFDIRPFDALSLVLFLENKESWMRTQTLLNPRLIWLQKKKNHVILNSLVLLVQTGRCAGWSMPGDVHSRSWYTIVRMNWLLLQCLRIQRCPEFLRNWMNEHRTPYSFLILTNRIAPSLCGISLHQCLIHFQYNPMEECIIETLSHGISSIRRLWERNQTRSHGGTHLYHRVSRN